uniref:Uncharacterized protein n=1 Tax=Anguilla anguilla TaxID=7936 RepID=A0A0E9T5L2_ANGAN
MAVHLFMLYCVTLATCCLPQSYVVTSEVFGFAR